MRKLLTGVMFILLAGVARADQIKQMRYLLVQGEVSGQVGRPLDAAVKTMFKIDTETNRTWMLIYNSELNDYVWLEVKESKFKQQ